MYGRSLITVNNLSKERKAYLAKKNQNKILIRITQIGILMFFVILWEMLAGIGLIDSFITSKGSQVLGTFIVMR